MKSPNILLTEDGRPLIADLGFAQDVASLRAEGDCTPIWAAPEVRVIIPGIRAQLGGLPGLRGSSPNQAV